MPEGLKGKKLYDYLVTNKAQIIAKKKSLPITSDALKSVPTFISTVKNPTAKKSDMPLPMGGVMMEEAEDRCDDILHVKVVANTSWWCDSQMDVLTDSCWEKSITEKGINIPHIADHKHVSTAHVGDVTAVYSQNIKLSSLGLSQTGSTKALIFETDIRREYNEKVYLFYKNGKINQHSIGLQYVSIGMAINDKDYMAEFGLWEKYIGKVINKDKAIEAGYFFIVTEIKVLENSCVLFGANELTPTLETEIMVETEIEDSATNNKKADTALQPPLGTGTQPLSDGLNIKSLLNVFQNEPNLTTKNRRLNWG